GGVAPSLRVGLEFLSNSLGFAAMGFWPLSGLVVLALCLASAWLLVLAWRAQPGERGRGGGLLAALAAVASVAGAVGLGRSGCGPGAGFMYRYATLAVPVLCAAYLAWLGYGTPKASRFVQGSLLALAGLLVAYNVVEGVPYGAQRRELTQQFDA